MDIAVNVPTSAGAFEYSNLVYCDEISWNKQREFGKQIDEFGFDGISVPDHLMTGTGRTTECLTTLTGIAGATDDVYLYPKTINNEFRNPGLLAKTIATIDNISNGRMKLGMGAGWKEDEARAYGYRWPEAPERLRKMEEAIVLIKKLWTEDSVSFDGDYYQLDEAICKPQPTQNPRPPIMIGGGGEEFTLRIAAKHADTWNYWGSTNLIEHKLNVLESHCDTYDRNYDEIEKSWFARCIIRQTESEVEEVLADAPRFREDQLDDDENHLIGTPTEIIAEIERYQDLGIDEVVVEFVDFPRTAGASLFAEEVLPELS